MNVVYIERDDNERNPNYPNASASLIRFRIEKNVEMIQLKRKFAQWVGLPLSIMAFGYQGKMIRNDDTPLTLGLENQIVPNLANLTTTSDSNYIMAKWSTEAPAA